MGTGLRDLIPIRIRKGRERKGLKIVSHLALVMVPFGPCVVTMSELAEQTVTDLMSCAILLRELVMMGSGLNPAAMGAQAETSFMPKYLTNA